MKATCRKCGATLYPQGIATVADFHHLWGTPRKSSAQKRLKTLEARGQISLGNGIIGETAAGKVYDVGAVRKAARKAGVPWIS